MIPFVGQLLKYILIRILERRDHFYSFANQFFNDSICPELVGRFSPIYAAKYLKDLMLDKRQYQQIVSKLKSIQVKKNAMIDILNDIDSFSTTD